MFSILNLYSVLQVPREATHDDIEAAFSRAMQRLETRNMGQTAWDWLHGRDANEIRLAYEVLIDPKRRAAHDKELDSAPLMAPPQI
jgi:curved DNA-binding protein CbpA